KLLRGCHVSWVDAYGLLKFPGGLVRPARREKASSLPQVKIRSQRARGLFVDQEEGIVGLGLHGLFKIDQRRIVVLAQLGPASLESARVSQTAAAGQISHYPDESCGCSAGSQPGKRRPEDATT